MTAQDDKIPKIADLLEHYGKHVLEEKLFKQRLDGGLFRDSQNRTPEGTGAYIYMMYYKKTNEVQIKKHESS